MLPVKFKSRGRAYLGFRRRSATAKNAPYSLLRSQWFLTESRCSVGCGGGWWARAARRMKGVVRPQASPTRMKLTT